MKYIIYIVLILITACNNKNYDSKTKEITAQMILGNRRGRDSSQPGP